jgi:hypothetical protein
MGFYIDPAGGIKLEFIKVHVLFCTEMLWLLND